VFNTCMALGGLMAIAVVLVAAILVPLGILRAVRLNRQGRLAIRRWAVLVFLASAALSSSAILLLLLSGVITRIAPSDVSLAPWIHRTWAAWGWTFALAWVAGLAVILWRKGIHFSDARLRRRVVLVVAAVMVPLSLAAAAASLMSPRLMWGTTEEIASAPSPDGRLRVRAYCHAWLDVSFSLESESNVRYPILTRWLGGAGFGEAPFSWDLDKVRLAWSADSQVVALWIEGSPIVAYDFSTGESRDRSWFGAGDRLTQLFVEHGGEAP
jgi:hypothetical protein